MLKDKDGGEIVKRISIKEMDRFKKINTTFKTIAKKYAYLWQLEEEDICGELWVAYLKKREMLENKPMKFVVKSCINYIIDQYRKSKCILLKKRAQTISIDELSREPRESPKSIGQSHKNLLIKEFKELLSKREKEVLQMYEDGFTQKEIAGKFGVSQQYVSKIIKRIKNKYLRYF